MPLRIISVALALGGLALLGLATHSYFTAPAGPSFVAVETDLAVGDCIVGQVTEIVIPLKNNSDRPVRVVGWASC
ncbi:MAG: hypothetical protein L0Z62_14940 [Gemmataceae bacterium]|nr:hypothetical protein [Gemmataceae bacterium]